MLNKSTAVVVLAPILLLTAVATAAERYIKTEPVTGQPVVDDSVTGLMWQGCSAGQTGLYCTTDAAETYTWINASSYCSELTWGGHTDWRLPEPKELFSIADLKRERAAIDRLAFPRTMEDYYWTATNAHNSSTNIWTVHFWYGDIRAINRARNAYVRCVRR